MKVENTYCSSLNGWRNIMSTIVKLGFGTIRIGAKSLQLLLDKDSGGPDFRADLPEISGPNTEPHLHFGENGKAIPGAQAFETAGWVIAPGKLYIGKQTEKVYASHDHTRPRDLYAPRY